MNDNKIWVHGLVLEQLYDQQDMAAELYEICLTSHFYWNVLSTQEEMKMSYIICLKAYV